MSEMGIAAAERSGFSSMNWALIASLLFHVLLIVAMVIGPWSRPRKLEELGKPIEVVMATSLPTDAIPKPTTKPVPQPPSQPEPNRAPQQPPPSAVPTPPKPQVLEEKSEPLPEVKAEAKIIEKPKLPEPVKAPEPPKPKPTPPTPPKPQEKPTPKIDFQDSLKNLQKELTNRTKPDEPKPKKTDLAQAVSEALQTSKTTTPPTPSATTATPSLTPQGLKDDELARVRDQIIRCWNPPVGARDADQMEVQLQVDVGSDKIVQQVSVVKKTAQTTDQFAESTVRAVYICNKLELPDGKYSVWNRIFLNFSSLDLR